MHLVLRCCVVLTLVLSSLPVSAQSIPYQLPSPNRLLELTQHPTRPLSLQGIRFDPKQPLRFDFILDKGQAVMSDRETREQGMRLAKYFMAALTFEGKDLWVNLSPYEKDRIMSDDLSRTQLGQDLLVEDYTLKQLASSLTHPDKTLGILFWKKVYQQSVQRLGSANVTVGTLNKVWIVPENAEVYVKDNVVLVNKVHLKVMIEADYLAQKKNVKSSASDSISTQVMKEVIIPVLEKEVNEGSHFVVLRQIVNASVLAQWYKRNIKEAVLTKVYANQQKVAGIDDIEKKVKEDIYHQYLVAYKKGVYNFIREEESTRMPRKYFSGGLSVGINDIKVSDNAQTTPSTVQIFQVDASPVGEGTLIPSNAEDAIKLLENSFLRDVKARLKERSKRYPRLIQRLISRNVSVTNAWQEVHHEGGVQQIYHNRTANNDDKGTPKGGIRWLTATDLLDDPEFTRLWKQFNGFNPTEDQAKRFIARWVDQEAQALAILMTLKTAGLDLSLGGAKGAVFIGNITRAEKGWKLEKANIREPKLEEAVARAHARYLAEHNAIGFDIDCPAGDKNTNARIMEYYNDEYIRYLIEQGQERLRKALTLEGKFVITEAQFDELWTNLHQVLLNVQLNKDFYRQDSIDRKTATPFIDEVSKMWRRFNGRIKLPIMAAVTGKGVEHGGILGRDEATGEGVAIVLKAYVEDQERDVTDMTVAIQGFGNVGSYTALGLIDRGFKVTAFSDFQIVLEKKEGYSWTAEELKKILKLRDEHKKSIVNLWQEGYLKEFEGTVSVIINTDPTVILDSILQSNVDIFVPAFSENQITEDNFHRLRARIVAEAGNGPTTKEAERKLTESGVKIIPDLLGNGGGVNTSDFERDQGNGIPRSHAEVSREMESSLLRASRALFARQRFSPTLTLRQNYFDMALRKLEEAYAYRPIKEESASAAMASVLSANGGIDLEMDSLPIAQYGMAGTQLNTFLTPVQLQTVKGFMPVFVEMKSITLNQLLN